MRVLVLCDDYWHPASVVKGGLEPLADSDFEFEYMESMDNWVAEKMDEFPVVILSKSSDISSKDRKKWTTDEAQEAFNNYVCNGGGLLAIHAGTAGYKDANILRGLLGGVFTHHPEQCPVTVEVKESHRITEGFTSFTLTDEHYFIELDDPNVYLFLNTVSQHGTQPGGWTRTHGKGRICVLTPGHNLDVWLHPGFQTLMRNSLNWCSGKL